MHRYIHDRSKGLCGPRGDVVETPPINKHAHTYNSLIASGCVVASEYFCNDTMNDKRYINQ